MKQMDLVNHNGKTMSAIEWANFCGLDWKTFWIRNKRWGIHDAIERVPFSLLCTFDGCNKRASYDGKKLCNTHYYRKRRFGSTGLRYERQVYVEPFWKSFEKSNSGCWLWIKTLSNKGYGVTTAKGKRYLAHRLSWILHNGDIPGRLCILHKCDTPACVNPDHLFLGTQSDNMRDMHRKERNPWQTRKRA